MICTVYFAASHVLFMEVGKFENLKTLEQKMPGQNVWHWPEYIINDVMKAKWWSSGLNNRISSKQPCVCRRLARRQVMYE